MLRYLSLLALIGSCLLLGGCGSGANGLSTVTGTVTMDGSPLEGATVIFAPAEGGRGNAVATTDAAGKYEMKYGSNTGVLPGTYIVQVQKSEFTITDEREMIPAKYNNDSSLEAVVTEDGPNVFDFELNSK